MTAVCVVAGQVRGVRDLTRKTENGQRGEKFARVVSVLTEHGDVLGETVGVVAWESDFGFQNFAPGDIVDLIVDMSAGKYGLEATLKGVLDPSPAKG